MVGLGWECGGGWGVGVQFTALLFALRPSAGGEGQDNVPHAEPSHFRLLRPPVSFSATFCLSSKQWQNTGANRGGLFAGYDGFVIEGNGAGIYIRPLHCPFMNIATNISSCPITAPR